LAPYEREFELPGLVLAAKEWGASGQRPVMALHGWLDNAGSFDLLAPLLDGCHVVAVDSAGHGASASRSPDSAYNIWQDVGDVAEIADQLGWTRFNLLGHSRGASIAALFAGTFPARAERVVLIEGGIPVLGTVEESPDNLAKAITETKLLRDKSGRVFLDRDAAIRERANGFSKVSVAAAEVLARRSLLEVPGGLQWHADQRLKATSEVRFTAEQVKAFLERISAPVLALLATDSPFSHRPAFLDVLGAIRDLRIERLPGGHHLHLEGGEERIAAAMRHFFEMPLT
jgi:pimeloyl-ACP methyl ester carboxylesterase